MGPTGSTGSYGLYQPDRSYGLEGHYGVAVETYGLTDRNVAWRYRNTGGRLIWALRAEGPYLRPTAWHYGSYDGCRFGALRYRHRHTHRKTHRLGNYIYDGVCQALYIEDSLGKKPISNWKTLTNIQIMWFYWLLQKRSESPRVFTWYVDGCFR